MIKKWDSGTCEKSHLRKTKAGECEKRACLGFRDVSKIPLEENKGRRVRKRALLLDLLRYTDWKIK